MPDYYSLDYYSQSSAFFQSLLFSKDKFSWIINSKQDNLNQLQGIRKNYGFEYILGYSDSAHYNLLGIVLYVHAKSNAKTVGIKRGDIFQEINNTAITIDNYENLLALEKTAVLFRRYTNEKDSSFIKELYAEDLKINPIQASEVYTIENQKIGYICYTQFISDNGDGTDKYKQEILDCFKNFRNENISELILDFRYNPGGLIDLAILLSSLIVPNADTEQIALIVDYNNKLNELYHKQGLSTDLKFGYYPQSYVGQQLKRVFIITGTSTASASEAVINSLLPYMEVILVGEKTYGKNYGSTMYEDLYNPNNTWVIQPIILKLFNAQYKSDYDNGFIPDYTLNEFSYLLVELGNIKEPLLNYCLSIIQGENKSVLHKSQGNTDNFLMPVEYSFNKQIHSLPILMNLPNGTK